MKAINFIKTKQYKQFSEFCRACQRDNILGICYGAAGVGKTESAREYAKWYKINHLIQKYPATFPETVPFSMKNMNSVLYNPSLLLPPKQILSGIHRLARNFTLLKEMSIYGPEIPMEGRTLGYEFTNLVIIDEAEKLKPQSFELIREIYDEGKMTFIFIGMPGIERIIERFPQLYSRIGFLHQFHRLEKPEIEFILEKHFSKLGIKMVDSDFTDQEAISAIIRITNGNFRLINRLLKQSLRIMKVNCMTTLTKEIIEAARSCLLIGEK